jgi:hypothetical protein
MRLAVVSLLSLACIFSEAVTQIGHAEQPCENYMAECGGGVRIEMLRQYFRTHAHIRLGEEQRLANGVAWRFFTDESRDLAVPRITWMPDRAARLRANGLFDAIHGGALLGWDLLPPEWRDARGLIAAEMAKLKPSTETPFLQPPEMGLTYASSKLVSYIQMYTMASNYGTELMAFPEARVMDLVSNRVFVTESCERSENDPEGGFRLGDFLNFCSEASLKAFVELWIDKMKARERSEEYAQDPWAADCMNAMQPLTRLDIRRFSLFLTPSGLGVYALFFWRMVEKHCLLHKSAFNPIIIPYREFRYVMRPGPWRDELLSLK